MTVKNNKMRIVLDKYLANFCKNMNLPSIVGYIGSCGSGKTTLLIQMLSYLCYQKKIDYAYIFTNNPAQYNNIFPEKYVQTYYYHEKQIEKLLNYQIQFRDERREPPNCAIILDDPIGRVNFNSKIVSRLFAEHRHYNISICIAYQYINKTPPLIRGLMNYLFLFRMTSKSSMNACLDLVDTFYETNNDAIDEFRELKNYDFIAYNHYTGEKKKHKLEKIINFKIRYGKQ